MRETFEDKVNGVLNGARDNAGKMAQGSLTLHVRRIGKREGRGAEDIKQRI
jgi:hypothetical protein